MTAALPPVADPECKPLFGQTRAFYLALLKREILPNQKSIFEFATDAERIAEIAGCLRGLGVTASRPKSPGTGQAAPLPSPRPKTASPEMFRFSKHFNYVFPGELNWDIRERTKLCRDLFDRLVEPMSKIIETGHLYRNAHGWKIDVHWDIGCALLHGLQSTFGDAWDSDHRIKAAWAAAYHNLVVETREKKLRIPTHLRAPSGSMPRKIVGGMVRPTGKTAFSPMSKPSRILGIDQVHPLPATAAAAAPENKTTQTSSPTTTPPSKSLPVSLIPPHCLRNLVA